MPLNWKDLEGSIIEGRFYLRQHLGGARAGAVFLADEGEAGSPKTAIKLIPAEQDSESQLRRLRAAEHLSHPHLLRLLHVGSCSLGEGSFFYVVMEHAEENLEQLLPHRTLTANEAQDLIEPLLNVLAYLHAQGLVHGHVQPSNILAIGDRVKLSSDSLYTMGESAKLDLQSIYTPPEAATGPLTAAADVWSLGMTLLESLRGRPQWDAGRQQEPAIPDSLPLPFLDVVRHCLRREPSQRWTLEEIAGRLRRETAPTQPTAGVTRSLSQSRRYTAAALAALAMAATLGAFAFYRSSMPKPVSSDSLAAMQSSETAGEEPNNKELAAASAEPDNVESLVQEQTTPAPLPPTKPLSMRETIGKENSLPIAGEQDLVVHREMPRASRLALNTIQGTVRVGIVVEVNASGDVAEARFESEGPSRYFADRAMQAAKLWKFRPQGNGQGAPREWDLRFEFRRSGTTVVPVQAAP
ncbi:MAG: TonB family protein [Candidatus Korobacteraceae bacterium]